MNGTTGQRFRPIVLALALAAMAMFAMIATPMNTAQAVNSNAAAAAQRSVPPVVQETPAPVVVEQQPTVVEGSDGNSDGNGANVPGPYDPTGVGSNDPGAGNGNAVGMPDAGTVGNADDKNPPGQQPGGSDPNQGYECDNNPGVGDGNPAHTGCSGDETGNETGDETGDETAQVPTHDVDVASDGIVQADVDDEDRFSSEPVSSEGSLSASGSSAPAVLPDTGGLGILLPIMALLLMGLGLVVGRFRS